MNLENYRKMNREAWNEVAPYHQKAKNYEYKELFKNPDYSVLDETSRGIFKELNIAGKAIAHVCCNNGVELISAYRLGAQNGVGFDISDEFVKEAVELAGIAKANCRFVRTDIYELEEKYYNRFDIVMITIGALCWFKDLNKFFEKVSGLLNPGGKLFIYEAHSFLYMIPLEGDDGYDEDNLLKCHHSYFKKTPWIDNDGLDYLGGTSYNAKTAIDFTHTLSEIFTGIIKNSMNIIKFEEYPHDIGIWKSLEIDNILPMSYALVAERK